MKKWNKLLCLILAVVMLASAFTVSGFAQPLDDEIVESVSHLADEWREYNYILNDKQPLEYNVELDGTTTITLHRANLLTDGSIKCTCGDENCAADHPIANAKPCVEYTKNGNMVNIVFGKQTVNQTEVITAAITPTPDAVSDSVVEGNFYYQPTEGHRTRSVPFSFLLGNAKHTFDQTSDYANDAVNLFGNTTIKANISNHETYSIMLCTTYWSCTDYQTATPVSLTVNGCSAFSVSARMDTYKTWGNCIWIDFTPLTTVEKTTEFTGTFDFVNSGAQTLKIPFSITQGNSVLDPSVEYAQQFTDIAQNQTIDEQQYEINLALYGEENPSRRVITGSTFKDCAYHTCLCSYTWADEQYLSGNTVDVSVEGTELVTAKTIHKAWSGDDSWIVWLALVPTEAGKAVSEDTLAEGSVRFKLSSDAANNNWEGCNSSGDDYATVDFALTLTTEQPIQPEITITPKQTFSFMQMTSYWAAEGAYTARTKLTATGDEGLVEFYAYPKYYAPWSSDAVYIEVVPTEAAKLLSSSKTLSGTYTIEDRSHTERKLAYHILLTTDAGNHTSDMSIANLYEKHLIDPTPLQRSFSITDETKKVSVLLQSDWQEENLIKCSCGDIGCKTLVKPENLVFDVTEGAEYADISVTRKYNPDWSMFCNYVSLVPTDAAREALLEGPVLFAGKMHYESGTHRSADYAFEFTLESRIFYDEGQAGSDAVVAARRKDEPKSIVNIVKPGMCYRTLLIYTGVIPYMYCETDGLSCPINHIVEDFKDHDAACKKHPGVSAYTEYTEDDLRIEITNGEGLLDITAKMEDGVINLYADTTEAADKAEPYDNVSCLVYFEKDGHRTAAIPVDYFFYGDPRNRCRVYPSNLGENNVGSLQILSEMPIQLDSMINNLRVGSGATPINAVLDPKNTYRGLLMTKAMVSYVPCEKCGNDCSIKDQHGENDLKICYTKNGDMIESTQIEVANYDGWGDSIYLTITLSEKAMTADPKTAIKGYYYFESNGHRSVQIPFVYSLFEQTDELVIKKSITESCTDLVVLDIMAYQVDAIADALRNNKIPSTLQAIIQPDKQYRSLLMTRGLIPYVPCTDHGINCPMNKEFSVEDIVVKYTSGEEYADLQFEFWNYDGWGDCVYLYVLPTEKAASAPFGSKISGTICYSKNGHTTKGIPFCFTLQEMPFVDVKGSDAFYDAVRHCYKGGFMYGTDASHFSPASDVSRAEAIKTIWQMAGSPSARTKTLSSSIYQINDCVINLMNGRGSKRLGGNILSDRTSYVALMTDGLIPFVPCIRCMNGCHRKTEFTTDDLQVVITEGAEYADISFERRDYLDWGELSHMVVKPTEAAKNAPEGAVISGFFFYKIEKHTSAKMTFTFTIDAGFTDVPDGAEYQTAVLWAVENGILNGMSSHSFKPAAAVTREQTAKLLCGYARYLRGESVIGKQTDVFSDFNNISTWAKEAVCWANDARLLMTDGNNRIAPKEHLSRAGFAQMLAAFDQTFIKK